MADFKVDVSEPLEFIDLKDFHTKSTRESQNSLTKRTEKPSIPGAELGFMSLIFIFFVAYSNGELQIVQMMSWGIHCIGLCLKVIRYFLTPISTQTQATYLMKIPLRKFLSKA